MSADQEEQQAEGLLKQLGVALKGGGEGLYNLYTVATGTALGYYNAIMGGSNSQSGEATPTEMRNLPNVKGWSAGVNTMYGGAAFETAEEQDRVETFMNEHGPGILSKLGLIELDDDDAKQSGGGDSTDHAADAQKVLAMLNQYVDPRKITLDGAVDVALQAITEMNHKMEDLSRQAGIIKLENTIHGIPLQEFGIQGEIPTRAIIVILTGVFEVIRLVSLFGFPGSTLFRIFGSFAGGLLEAAKGDWKSSLFTFMGLMGSGGLVIGAFAKIIVKVMSFISERKRDRLIFAAYESAKSLVVGVVIFLFTILSPLSIKQVVDQNLEQFSQFTANIQEQIEPLKAALEADPAIAGKYDLEFFDILMRAPDFDSLQGLEELFGMPAFSCSKPVQDFVEQMRFVPPALLLLELMGINTTTTIYKQSCAEIPEPSRETIDGALIEALRPRLRPKPGVPPPDRASYSAAFQAVDRVFGSRSEATGQSESSANSSSQSVAAGTASAFGSIKGLVAAGTPKLM